jgi:hypothetical protein
MEVQFGTFVISHEMETSGQDQPPVTFTWQKELLGITGNRLGGIENQSDAMK